ncbi:hypothetical protein Dsin_025806 [Dipteronia sinensis]|uniref:O-methyltransferase C-terminal domain-containing protein n=1 Tax=Dipteronia sinensis TaxID=43782 RepID=A0AAD9ZX24_9ROSI|nr:hypothetical protein Dsin_025806 [Dipteronia sinensis]
MKLKEILEAIATHDVVIEEDDSPAASSFERKVSRSRSIGCGSRSFSSDFFERISTGFGDCTLRGVESQREGKSKSNNNGGGSSSNMKERVKCGGIFGVEHIGGDMFESVPKGDAIFMKWILHDWSDEHCLRLLKNCYKSIPEDGKLIVVETIIPDFPEANTASKAAFQIDVLMMTQNPGGKERSRQEYMALATGAGYSGIRFETSACNSWVMEFYK